MKEKLRAALEAAKKIQTDAGERELTDDEVSQIEAHLAEAEKIKVDMARAEKVAALSAQVDNELEGLTVPEAPRTGNAAHARVDVVGERAKQDPTGGFCSFDELLLHAKAVREGRAAISEPLRILAAASGNQQLTGADGGFLVPTLFANQVWSHVVNETSLIGMTTQYMLNGYDSIEIPANAESNRSSTVAGGALAYWLAEADQITTSKPTFRQIKLEPHDLACLFYATNKLLRNTNAFSSVLQAAAADALRYQIDKAILRGDGAGKPLGLLNSASLVSIAKKTGQAATTLVKENIDNAIARMLPAEFGQSIWVGNPDIRPQLQALAANVGTGGFPVYLSEGMISGSPLGTLYGRPIVFNEHASTLGSIGDLTLWSPKSYLVATSGGTESAESPHIRFDYMETAFRFSTAIDGTPGLASAITPAQGSNTLSTHVAIADRS